MPRRIGRFEIRRELGRGGCGVVFLAFDPKLHRDIALKVPHPGALLSGEMRNRFVREAWAAAGLNHPNIVAVYEAGDAGPVCYIATAYCPGSTLAGWLKGRQEPVPFRLAAMLVATLADALEHAHGRGVLHRDLKPSNVLMEKRSAVRDQKSEEATGTSSSSDLCPLSSDLFPLITDFGLAKLLDEEIGDTKTGVLMGTASYMAPEQAAGRTAEIGRAVDIYALGAVLYELLTGRPPFQGDSALDILQQVASAEPVQPHRLRGKVPRDLETICLKCLEKEPRRRYATAAALEHDLRRFLAGEPIAARPVSTAERLWRWCRRNPGLATLGASVAALLVLVAGVSAAAALRLRDQESATRQNLERALVAEDDATRKLFDSYLAQAEASRWSGRAGQRFDTLATVRKAAALLPRLNITEDDVLQLRNTAAACLALPDLRLERQWDVPPGYSGGVAVDADAERYARLEIDGPITIRRMEDNSILARIPGVGDAKHTPQLHFSPDGRYLAIKAQRADKFPVQTWDLISMRPTVETWGVHSALVRDLTFSPDSRMLAACQPDGAICLFDVQSGEVLKRLAPGPTPVGFRFHPDGRQLAVWGNNRGQVIDVESGKVLRTMPDHSTGAMCWSPDGRFLATFGGEDNNAHIWDAANWMQHMVLQGHQLGVTQVAFSHDGELVATTSWDGTTRLWDTTGRQLLNCPGFAVGFSRDDRWLAFGRNGYSVGRWEVAAGRERRVLHASDSYESWDAAISPRDRLLLSTDKTGVRLWDWETGAELAMIPLPRPNFAAFVSSGDGFITSGPAGLYRWPVGRSPTAPGRFGVGPPQLLGQLPATPHDFHNLAISHDGRRVAVRRSGKVFLVDPDSKEPRVVNEPNSSLALSSDGKWLAAGDWHASGVRVWDADAAEHVHDLPTIAGTLVSFSPDGRWLIGAGGREYRFWNAGTWELSHRIERDHTGDPSGIAFTRDSRMAAVSHSASAVKLVDPATGREFVRLPAAGPNVRLAFSADGGQLVTTAVYQAVVIWNLQRVRDQLLELGLGWDLPTSGELAELESRSPISVELDLGDMAEGYLQLARNHRARHETTEAASNYRRFLALRPDDASACNNFAWLLATAPPHARRLDEALPLALKAVEKAPRNGYYLDTLGVVYFRLGKYEAAIERLLEAGEHLPSGATAWEFFFLAMSHYRLGNSAKAHECYVKAMRWWGEQPNLSPSDTEELTAFRQEADATLAQGRDGQP